jgi:uncharacterized protein (TIGR02246 family)
MKQKNAPRFISAIFASTTVLLVFLSPAMADDLRDELIAKEKIGWMAWASRDGEAAGALMTEDAVHVVAGASVETGRDKIMAGINGNSCKMKSFEFADVKVRQLSPDIAILTYTATQDATCQGQRLPEAVYSTVVYVQQAGEWRWTSYQETALE